MSGLWPWLLGASAACYGLKLAGMSVPDRVLRHPRVSLVADLRCEVGQIGDPLVDVGLGPHREGVVDAVPLPLLR